MYGIFGYIWYIYQHLPEQNHTNEGEYTSTMDHVGYTIWLFNIAMENHHAINR